MDTDLFYFFFQKIGRQIDEVSYVKVYLVSAFSNEKEIDVHYCICIEFIRYDNSIALFLLFVQCYI